MSVVHEALEATRRLIIAAGIGSCTCHTKTPEASFHAADCRYLTLMSALDNLDIVSEALTRATRFVNCEVCQTEGRILTNDGGPDDVDHGVCPECNGTRVVEIETQPITLDDLDGA